MSVDIDLFTDTGVVALRFTLIFCSLYLSHTSPLFEQFGPLSP